jgi:hypothetical protein
VTELFSPGIPTDASEVDLVSLRIELLDFLQDRAVKTARAHGYRVAAANTITALTERLAAVAKASGVDLETIVETLTEEYESAPTLEQIKAERRAPS